MNKHLDNLSKFSDLKEDHPALSYVKNRKIPKEHWDKLYLADKFYEWSNSIFPEKFKSINIDYPRLVIPFFDKSGEIFAYQGRAFGKEEPRYITLKIVSEKEKIYGLERINYNSHVYVVEGPLDSLFLDNCLEVAGADLNLLKLEPTTTTAIYDNEPRNKELVKQIETMVNKGYRVCLWNDSIKEKDINDMIVAGKTPLTIQTLIEHNSVQGVEAELKFNTWRKC